MGYLIKAILGAAAFVGGTVLFDVKLVELLETGTCASGNQPFEVRRECPEGTAAAAGLMVAGVFAALIGGALFAFRGQPPWRERRSSIIGAFGWSTFAWGAFFTGTGAATVIASRTSEAMPEDGKLGGTIVGTTFLVMGVPALLFALWSFGSRLGGRDERPSTSTTSAPGFGGGGRPGAGFGSGDAIARLERLQRLRESGALTESEFAREKAEILARM